MDLYAVRFCDRLVVVVLAATDQPRNSNRESGRSDVLVVDHVERPTEKCLAETRSDRGIGKR